MRNARGRDPLPIGPAQALLLRVEGWLAGHPVVALLMAGAIVGGGIALAIGLTVALLRAALGAGS
jgi:hypothetical protein